MGTTFRLLCFLSSDKKGGPHDLFLYISAMDNFRH